MEGIITAIENNQWQVLTGLVLLLVTALVRDVSTRAKVTGLAAKLISAISSYLSGIAVLLPVVPVWWHAALIALGTPLASQGLRDLLVDLVGRLIKRKKALPVVVVVLLTPSCTIHKAQIATQTALTSVAEGVDAGDRLVARMIPGAADEAIATARVRMGNCIEGCDALAYYHEEMEPWRNAVDGFEIVVASLLVVQELVEVWIATGTLSESAGDFCEELGDTTGAAMDLLGVIGVDLPPLLEAVPRTVDILCNLIAVNIDPEGGE